MCKILWVILLTLSIAYGHEKSKSNKSEKSEMKCSRLNDDCTTSPCCIGTCIADKCNDGLYKNIRDRNLADQVETSQLIAAEMATETNVDVSEHVHINLLPSLDECGQSYRPRRRKRIVGGVPYALGKYPWAVSLHMDKINENDTVLQCGGSLINNRYILTAAHCVTRLITGRMLKWVTLGNVDRRLKKNCYQDSSTCGDKHFLDVEIEKWIVHEGYSEAHVRNDIALIRLKEEVNYTNYITPICLPRNEAIVRKWNNGELTVVGWGTQNTPEDDSPQKMSFVAQEVDMTLVHRSNCDRFFTSTIGKLRRSQICAGGYPGKGDCAGDSGGSLFKFIEGEEDPSGGKKAGRHFIFGLVSTGAVTKCAKEGTPSVFTSVMYYMPWILDNLSDKKDVNVGDMASHSLAIPRDEFATGIIPPVDITTHQNIHLLPKFPDCGMIPGHQDPIGEPTTSGKEHGRVKRVVGGIIQSVGAFPWMAQIYVRNVATAGDPVFRCGGVLISSRYVLTAAHCVVGIKGGFVLDGVKLGNFNRLKDVECIGTLCITHKLIPIEEYVAHDSFTTFARENDVALVRLSQDVEFNRFIQPICLPNNEDLIPIAWPTPNERRYLHAGWGRVSSDSSESAMSNLLVAANLTLESKRYCETVFVRKVGKLENSRICGGGTVPGKAECVGDTGGPMLRWITMPGPDNRNYTRMFNFGVLSVVDCAHQGIPSLYQNIVYFAPWIVEHILP